MRKLIRCKTTNTFLTKEGTWTQDVREAEDLRDRSGAYAATRTLLLNDIELYYVFGDQLDPEFDFAIPLPLAALPT